MRRRRRTFEPIALLLGLASVLSGVAAQREPPASQTDNDDDAGYPMEWVVGGVLAGLAVISLICCISHRAHHHELRRAEKRSAMGIGLTLADLQASGRKAREAAQQAARKSASALHLSEALHTVEGAASGAMGFIMHTDTHTHAKEDIEKQGNDLESSHLATPDPAQPVTTKDEKAPRGGAVGLTAAETARRTNDRSLELATRGGGSFQLDDDEEDRGTAEHKEPMVGDDEPAAPADLATRFRESPAAPASPAEMAASWRERSAWRERVQADSPRASAYAPPPPPPRHFPEAVDPILERDPDLESRVSGLTSRLDDLEAGAPRLTPDEAARRAALERAHLHRLEREMSGKDAAKGRRESVRFGRYQSRSDVFGDAPVARERAERDLFRALDGNGDGELEPSELLAGMRELGIRGPGGGMLCITHVHSMVTQADTNGNGTIDENEFCRLIATLRRRMAEQDAKDGKTTARSADLNTVMQSWGGDGLTDPDLAAAATPRAPPAPAPERRGAYDLRTEMERAMSSDLAGDPPPAYPDDRFGRDMAEYNRPMGGVDEPRPAEHRQRAAPTDPSSPANLAAAWRVRVDHAPGTTDEPPGDKGQGWFGAF